MLFNSYVFIFCFLPIVWAVFHLLKALSIKQAEQEHRESKRAQSLESLKSKNPESKAKPYALDSRSYMTLAKGFLVVASLFFYAYWKLVYLPILLGSMVVNYVLGRGILASFNGGGGEIK